MSEKSKFLKALYTVSDVIERLINVCVCIFLAAIGISVFAGVVGRNVNIPVVWLDELSTYSCIWATFFGFALACKYNMHSNVDILFHWFPKKARKYFELFWMAFGVIFMGIVLWSSREYLAYAYAANTLSAQLRIPLVYIYAGPVIGYAFGIYFVIVNMIRRIVEMGERKEEIQ